MNCVRCQHDNRDGARFCKGCGARLEASCPACGKEVAPAGRFCDECGHDLRSKSAEVAPSVNYQKPQSYTPKHLTEKILTTRSALEGERKLVTVLFADVANYTSLAEKLDPEEAHRIMDGCFRILMDEVHRCEGTINQFTGDGVMALFGAPVAHEDHAQRACHAALAIQKALVDYSSQVRREYDLDFRMRIGLNSGPVIVGRIGDDLRMDYTAVGDTTNLAARMQSLAEPGTVLLSANTHRLASRFFELEALGAREIKGKEEPHEVFLLLRPGASQTRIAASVAKGLTPFVGRERELSVLQEAWEKAATGSGQVVGIVGEAGVGKSRLLLELRNSLPAGSQIYLEGRCLHYGGSMPYLPVLDLLRQYFGLAEGEREHILRKAVREKTLALDPALERVLPSLYDLLSLRVDDDAYQKLEPKRKKERAFESLRDLLFRMCQEQPLVLAVEDLHWLDATSREFLDYLVGWVANSPCLLLLLYRPEFTHSWASRSYYTQVNVGQLSTQAGAEFMASLFQGEEVAPELQELILGRAGGNPLFVEELTRGLLENGSIRKEGLRYVLSRTASAAEVPDTVQGIIAARMDGVEENLKRTMQVASVIGREFAFQLLQTITGLREELKVQLLNLQGLEFIYRKALFPELEYIFKHILTQEVAYNSLLQSRRKELHEKTAEAIEQLYADRLEEFYEMLAYHYGRSDRLDQALRYLQLSAEKAKRNYSLREALRFHKESLALLGQLPETERTKKQQLGAILSTGNLLEKLAFPEEPLELYAEAERLGNELGDHRSLAILYSHLGQYHTFRGNLRGARDHLERAFVEAEQVADAGILGRVAAGLFGVSLVDGRVAATLARMPGLIDLLEQTVNGAQPSPSLPLIPSHLYGAYGVALAYLGRMTGADTHGRHALAIASAAGHPLELALAQYSCGQARVVMGRGPDAARSLEASLGNFEKAQSTLNVPFALAWLGFARFQSGDCPGAIDCLERAIQMLRSRGIPYGIGAFSSWLAGARLELGDLSSALDTLDQGLASAEAIGETMCVGLALALLGPVEFLAGRASLPAAVERTREGVRILEELELRPMVAMGRLLLGELFAAAGETKQASEALKTAEESFQSMQMDYWLARAQRAIASL
ncbi:MAG: AAA family ATPase [Deltaproteobacteria bacterium]|nr:AAA family ATPase [Deltaproteobacteria bacterium]